MKFDFDKYLNDAKKYILDGIMKYIEGFGSLEFEYKPILLDEETLIKGISTYIVLKDEINKLYSISIIKNNNTDEEYLLGKFWNEEISDITYSYLEFENIDVLFYIITCLKDEYEKNTNP